MKAASSSVVRTKGLRLGVVGTSVSSCSPSSLAVVEFDTLSTDKRDKISSRVDALIGRTEKKEESAVARRVDVPLKSVEGVAAGGGTPPPSLGGVEGREGSPPEGGGKNERFLRDILRTTGGRSKVGWSTSVSERERE